MDAAGPPGTDTGSRLEERPPASPEDQEPPQEQEPRRGALSFFRELPGLILVAFLLALLIKSFLVQAFYIPSESMQNTLLIGDRVLVNKVNLNFREPQRGEIIVFENPHAVEEERGLVRAFWHWLTEGLGFSSNPEKDFIKRVIGVGGDTIEIKGGQTFVNGKKIREPYLHPERDLNDYGPYKVPPDSYFVMGDNRANSADSRTTLGYIPEEKIVGKAFVILWPPARFDWQPSD